MEKKDFPPRDFYEDKPIPVDKVQKALTELATVLGLAECDIAIVIVEKKETGGYQIEHTTISKAYVQSPPFTLRSKALELVNKFLQNRKVK